MALGDDSMRMWMVPTEIMCDRHLLGEHHEIHMLEGCLENDKDITPFLGGLVLPEKMHARHAAIIYEMEQRGFKHNSPLTSLSALVRTPRTLLKRLILHNMAELEIRCAACKTRQKLHKINKTTTR